MTPKEGDIEQVQEEFYLVCNDKELYLEIYDKVLFSIQDKNKMYVQLLGNTEIEEALPYFYGTVLTFLLHIHMMFPLHGSAILSKSGINMFCAHSGTGKSTLAFNLSLKGYPLFSDDRCIVRWDSILKKYISQPTITAVRLWQESIDKVQDKSILTDGTKVIKKEDKFQFNLQGYMHNRVHSLKRIIIIKKNDKIKNINSLQLSKENSLPFIRNHMHRPRLIVGEQMTQRYLQFTKNLSNLIPVILVTRPTDIPVEKFIDFMDSKIDDPFV